MSLIAGDRIGPYEIVAPLGAGGMGEVYRARDTKLNRDVAIKVLLPAVANDPDRLARFSREAQVLASLNHPNIAHIYGIEDADGVKALVLELVEGEDLAQRIARGLIPLDEALPIARQIADALEAAHEQGIIHRDLKPANIKIRPDGTVKVLDFGLAKALDGPGGSGRSGGLENSPTLSMHATQAGIILGTAAYMSPEQATGKAVDKRSDLWAFGVVLLEMLTGRPVFTGESVSHVLAAVLRADPDWSALPATTPAPIRRLLRRCLDKDRKRRLADAADARLEIEDALTASSAADGAASPLGAAPRAAWSRVVPWTSAAAALVFAIAWLAVWAPWRPAPVPAPRKLLASIGAEASLPTDRGASAILSPDGTMLAFVAQQAGQTRLFIRKLEQLSATALAGTEDAADPFFSQDGQWIGFFASGKLKRASVNGGAPITLCDAPVGRGGTWIDDDTIVFAPSGAPGTKLLRIPTAGGSPAAFGTLSAGATTQRWPHALPAGRGVLYTEHLAGAGFDGANLVVASLSGEGPKVVVHGGYYGRYVPSGHLIYMQQGALFAVRFDLDRLETVGGAASALDGLAASSDGGGAQLAFSSEGTLVYLPGTTAARAQRPIDWLTRDGKTSILRATKANWTSPRFSPDGRRLALDILTGKQRDIWVYEWARDTLTQLTFDSSYEQSPVWTPDGRRIVFASDRAKAGIANLYEVNADGTGEVTRLTESSDIQSPASWDPTGRFLAFDARRGASGIDLMILPMEGDAARGWTPGTPTVFLSTPAYEAGPMFSPDGRWIAYISNEAGGRNDVYVRPFPGPGGKWRISTEGGGFPHWSVATHELLFVDPAHHKVMVAPYAVVGDSFRADRPQLWSPTSVHDLIGNYTYDVHPDGKRLAVEAAQDQETVVQNKVVFVFNFFDYLRKIAPGTK